MSARAAVAFALLVGTAAGCSDRVSEPLPAPGGAWTAAPSVRATLIAPAAVLDTQAKLDFWTGMALFRDPWVTAPASTTARDGLGPLFNAQSCGACHRAGGRGTALGSDPNTVATVLRVGVRGRNGFAPHPQYGRQLQPRATFDGGDGARAGAYFEGEPLPSLAFANRELTLADGARVDLAAPRFGHAALGPGAAVSARLAPALTGLGLLEAIPDARLAALADPADRDGDGVSGRVHWRGGRAGRFGWKALHPTVAAQTAEAFAQDIGISNALRPAGSCAPSQARCRVQARGDDPAEAVELTRGLFDRVVFFTSHLAPPPAQTSTPRIARGRRAFERAGCAACHTPSHRVELPARAGGTQTVWPYTDLLLHDMGTGLADDVAEGDASGREWRTAPLWGLGRALIINPETGLLHDGRARTVTEAIGWHGGEGAGARDAFAGLDARERAALVAFVLAL